MTLRLPELNFNGVVRGARRDGREFVEPQAARDDVFAIKPLGMINVIERFLFQPLFNSGACLARDFTFGGVVRLIRSIPSGTIDHGLEQRRQYTWFDVNIANTD